MRTRIVGSRERRLLDQGVRLLYLALTAIEAREQVDEVELVLDTLDSLSQRRRGRAEILDGEVVAGEVAVRLDEPLFVGGSAFHSWLIIDFAAPDNPLGITATPGLEAILGE